MINWSDPDYKSAGTFHHFVPFPKLTITAGHFYALFQSVSVECNDTSVPGPGITSYVFGPNVTLDTPSINYSNLSTLLNGASSLSDARGLHAVFVAAVLALALFAHLF